MNKRQLRQRFPRCAVLVVADFATETGEVRVLRESGARVLAAGLGGEAERRELIALGVEAEGVVESREAVLREALDRLAAADVVLFGAGDWETERQDLLDAEREEAIADGRSLRAMLSSADERFAFLGSPAARARFALAWAAGAGFEDARAFAGDGSAEGKRGHKDENRRSTTGARSRPPGTGRRKGS